MASLTVSSFGPYFQISQATFAANAGDSITIINGPGGGATYDAAIVLDENLTITAFADVGLIQLSMATGIIRLNARGDSSFFITGNASGNIISGGNKDDLFLGEGGNDTLNGGGGDDTAAYLFAPAGVNINIANGGGSNGYGGTDTFTSIESLIGSQHSDTLIGDSADNYFFGLQGNDIITGAGGIDTVSYEDIGLGGSAVVVNLTTGSASDGFGGTDTLSGIERVIGSDFGDSLIGDSNDNSFLPGVGNDTVNGGGGTDFVSYETSQSGVNVNLPGQTASDGLGGTDTLISIEGVLGSIFGDSITGGSEANVFTGSAGSDTLNGGGGFDVARYTNSTSGVTVNLAAGTASDGLGGTDALINIEGVEGSAFADTLTGTSGDNQFWGMNGDDAILGGEGDDTASYALAASNYTVTYIPGDGTYTVAANTGDEGTDTLTSIEFLQFGFGAAPVDINSVVVNPPSPNGTYVGDANDNTFDPGDGDDTIDGQGGLDTVTYASSTGAINVNLATGVVDDGMGGTDTLTSIERVFGSNFGDTLTGSDGNDSFLPGLGDDTITGGLGIDTLQFFAATVVDMRNGTATGGEGTDTFTGIEVFFGSAQDDTFHDADGAFLYDGNGGTDLVSYTLSAGPIVANLVTGLVSDGSGAVDTLVAIERIAGSANSSDLFIAATTTTEIDGNAGLDTVSFSEFGSGVTVARNGNDLQATAAGGVRVDLKSIEIFEGSQHNDTLVGLGNSLDVLIGLGGNDRLENLQVGATGVLASYRVDPSAVTVNLATGSATDGFGGTDTLVNIDNVEGSAHNDTFTGNASANLFVGHAGNDTIDGGGGTDVAVYALAADQYTVTHNAITGAYTVTALSGTDGVDTLTNVERIAFENGNTEVAIGDVAVAIPTVTLTGDGTDNLFTPGAGDNNIIDGLGGFDTVSYATAPSGVTVNLQTGIASDGQGGSDSLTSIERIIGSAFADTITGSDADDTFEMTRSGNVIDGGAGIDTLSYINDATGITVNGTPGVVSQQNVSDPPKDTFSNIENFVGTRHYDLFYDTEGSHGYDGVDGQRDDLVLDWRIPVHIDLGLGQIIEETGGVNTFANIKRIIATSYDDRVVWAPSDTTVAAVAGDDTLSFANSATGIEFDFGATAGYHGVDGSGRTFVATGFEIVEGSAHDDVFQGSEWQTNIELLGLAGDDILRGASANSAAVDWVSYRLDPAGVSVNLDLGIASDGFGGADRLQHIDGVEGSEFADVLVGDGNGTLFRGLGGDDVFHGGGHASDTVVYKLAQNQYSIHYEAPINAFIVTALSGNEGTDVLRGITTLSFNDGANDVAIDTAAGGGSLALTIFTGSASDDYFALTSAVEAVYGMDGIDVVSYRSSPGAVTVNLATDTGLDGNGGSDLLWSIEGVAGSAFNDTLTGSGEDEIFFGSGGLDTMDAAGGSDTLSYVGYSEGVIVNRVSGRVETSANPLTTKDTITGFESYVGTAFDDVFYDRPGTISVDGLGGLDQFSAEHISEGGVFELGVGRVRYNSGREVSLSNIESIVGTQFDDHIYGDEQDNTFYGLGGDDVFFGFGGVDTVSYEKSVSSGVTVSLEFFATSTDAFGGQDRFSGIENLIGSEFNDVLTGSFSDNEFFGGGGNDTIDGSGGFDTVSYYSDRASQSAVNVNLDTGIAIDGLGGTDTLSNIERVIGTDLDDTITGSDADETFVGGAGSDTIDGGDGFDTVSYPATSNRVHVVRVDLAAGTANDGHGGVDTLSNIEGVIGGSLNDTLTGDVNDNAFTGRHGSDTIDGRDGTDTAYYDDNDGRYAGVHVDLSKQSADDGWGSTDTLLSIENLVGSSHADTLIGDEHDNRFVGGAGADTIIGGGGFDTIDYSGNPEQLLGGIVIVPLDPVGELPELAQSDPVPNLIVDLVAGIVTDGLGSEDTVSGIEGVVGSVNDDVFYDGAGVNSYDGGDGYDLLSYEKSDQAIHVEISSSLSFPFVSQVTSEGGTVDTFANIESFRGTEGNDRFTIGTDFALVARASLEQKQPVFDGGGGYDVFEQVLGPIGFNSDEHVFNLETGAVRLGSLAFYTIANFEGVVATGDHDTLIGTVGNNGFTGRGGNDVIDGADGTDTAIYALAQDQYTVSYDSASDSYTVTALSGDEGTDTLTNIEILSFDGGTTDVAIADALPAPLDTTSDFDGDGDDDIVYSLTASGNSVFNNADGSGGGWIGYADRSVIGVGDFNGDGDADLLFRFADGNHSGFDSGGGGPWLGRSDRTAVGIGDFNGDGDDDVLFQFADGNKHAADPNDGNTWIGFADRSIEGVGDFDGDGDDDVLFEIGGAGYVTNNVDGTGGRWLGGPNRDVAGIGDFDGDGDDDILFVQNTGGHIINDGEGGGMQWFGFADRTAVGIGDFDGDGNDDILFRLSDGNHTIISPNGVGRWIARTNNIVRDVGDYDGDGDDDILFEHPLGGFVVDQADGGAGLGMYFLDRTLVGGDPLGIGLTSDADLV